MKESNIQSEILLALSQADCLVFRVDTAGAWVGRVLHQEKGLVTLANARMIQAGLCTGGADVIGVHKPSGRFLAIEVKTATGRVSKEQENFIRAINKSNGIAGIARSVQDALDLLPTSES